MNENARNYALIAAALVAGVAGGFVTREFSSSGQQSASGDARRPIIQLVRQQPGIPSLADAIDSICPELAALVNAGAAASTSSQPPAAAVPAFVVSAGGWLMASTESLPMGDLQAVFGPGNSAAISEVRSDPVSGLSILKSAATDLRPVIWADQNLPRVGDFGFAVQNARGAGCSAEAAMVSSDFLTDGGAPAAYVRFDPMGPDLQPGTPVFASNGEVLGVVGTGVPTNAVVPAEMVSAILDELLRNSLSPTTKFGFRAVDYDAAVSQRLSNSRSRGAGVAFIQPNTPAAKVGLQAGDIVLGVDGSPVASASELGRALDSAGRSASLDIARGDQRLTFAVGRTSTS